MNKEELAHCPAQAEDEDIYALKALQRGEATPSQQIRALMWIVEKAARAYDLSYRQNDSYATAFAEGRRFVGLEVIKYSKIKTIKGNRE